MAVVEGIEDRPARGAAGETVLLTTRPYRSKRLALIGLEDQQSSSGGESHPSALPEPDVRLSPHPAPTLQPLAARPVAKERTGRDRGGRCAPASASPHTPGVGTVCTSAVPISREPC